jgi:hypothetical protein
VHGPSSPMAYQRLGLSPGGLLECVTLDSFGSAVGTALFSIQSVWPGDGMGVFVEASFLGCSKAALWPMLSGSFNHRGGAVLHLCTQQANVCSGLVQWPQRSVLHVETYRMRSSTGVTEPWAQALLASRGAAGGQTAAGLPGGSVGGAGPPGAAAGGAVAGSEPTPEELKKKVAELRLRLHRKRGIGEALAERAEQALGGRRGGR